MKLSVGDKNMGQYNNPFRPALAKPADDSVLANDPAADNFLAGNDRLSQHRTQSQPNPNLDRSYSSYRMAGLNNANNINGINQRTGYGQSYGPKTEHNTVRPTMDSFGYAPTPAPRFSQQASRANYNQAPAQFNEPFPPTEAPSAEPQQYREPTATPAPIRSQFNGAAGAAEPVNTNQTSVNALNDLANLAAQSPASDGNDFTIQTNNSDNEQPKGLRGLLGRFKFGHKSETSETTADTNQVTATTITVDNPFDNDISAVNPGVSAANVDFEDSDNANDNQSENNDSDSDNDDEEEETAGHQLSFSLLTVAFCGLFVISAGLATWFGVNLLNKNKALDDTTAQVQQLQDKANESSSSSSKESTQFNALQDKIIELTKQNDDKQKSIDNLNKTKSDQDNKIKDLSSQVADLQSKINSDTKVSTDVKSLLTTLCTNSQFSASAACVGGQPSTQAATQATTQNQAAPVNNQ